MSTWQGWLAAGDLGRLVETNVDADAAVAPVDSPNEEHDAARVAMAPARDGAPPYLTRIAVRSLNRLVIVPVSSIIRLEAEDNYVRIWADGRICTRTR